MAFILQKKRKRRRKEKNKKEKEDEEAGRGGDQHAGDQGRVPAGQHP